MVLCFLKKFNENKQSNARVHVTWVMVRLDEKGNARVHVTWVVWLDENKQSNARVHVTWVMVRLDENKQSNARVHVTWVTWVTVRLVSVFCLATVAYMFLYKSLHFSCLVLRSHQHLHTSCVEAEHMSNVAYCIH